MKTLTIPNGILIPEIGKLLKMGHTATLRVKGVSMRPFLEDGRDKVLLKPAKGDSLKNGDVVLAETGEKVYVLHRIYRIEGDKLVLRGDGNVSGKEYCSKDDVVAVVEAFYRKGRNRADSVGGWKWRLYSFLWPSSPFARRVLLALYRRVWLKIMPHSQQVEPSNH